MIIIGSTAIKYWFPEFKRIPKDLDVATQVKMVNNIPNIEYLENPLLFEDVDSSWDILNINNHNYRLLPKDLLYTLKASHLAWDINWEKHIYDCQFLKDKGCVIISDLFYKLYDYWNIYHSKNKRSDLKMSAERFFNNAIKCSHSHDYLHTLINPIPTYLKILKDGEEVDVDENKFNNLSFEDKCKLVYEEVEVMAYERAFHTHFAIRYNRMLKKFILSHAPIWEMMFIIDNYTLLSKPRWDYMEIINKQLQYGKNN